MSLWTNVKLGVFAAGALAIAVSVMRWEQSEPDDVKKAREIVESHDKKQRWARFGFFAVGCTALATCIATASHLAERERDVQYNPDMSIPTEQMYSE